MSNTLRERLAWMLYREVCEQCRYVEQLHDNDPIDTDVVVDGAINFAELADAVIDVLGLD